MDEKTTIKTVSIREASRILDCDRNYVLKLIKTGKLSAEKVENENGIPVWRLIESEVGAYAATKGQHRSGREDNRVKWITYATPAEMDDILASYPGVEAKRPDYSKKGKKGEAGAKPKATKKGRKAAEVADEA